MGVKEIRKHMPLDQIIRRNKVFIPVCFLVGRLLMFISSPLSSIKSYGDFWNFYALAGMGRPYFDLWIEFPPVFPFLSRFVYLISGGREQAYVYSLAFLFSLAQAFSIYIFIKFGDLLNLERGPERTLVYAFLLIGIFYGWAYFDPLSAICLLGGLYLIAREKDDLAAIVIAAGALTKWIPLVAVPLIWKRRPFGKALRFTGICLMAVLITWSILFALSPDFTSASLASQFQKGSWESIWAVLEGNLRTGNFGQDVDRLDPQSVFQLTPPDQVIPAWITLALFGGVGIWLWVKAKINDHRSMISFAGLTLVLFFIWSPGYSPQWVLLLLPLVLLTAENHQYFLLGLTILMVNLIEWPVLLSRGRFDLLWMTVLIRTIVYILSGFLLFQQIFKRNEPRRKEIVSA